MREHILDVAESLFYREGIRAVGVDRIIAESGIAKATLYAKFTSKHELVLAYLNARSNRVLANLKAVLSSRVGTADEKIFFIFDELERIGQPGGPFRGCAFMLAVGEHPGQVDIREVAVRHKRRFRAVFEELLSASYSQPTALAEQIAVCYEGALTMVALTGDTGAMPAAKNVVATLLSVATVQTE